MSKIERKDKVISMSKSFFSKDDIKIFLGEAPDILEGKLSMGKWVRRFEKEAAKAQDIKYAHAVSSGTAALEVSMLAAGIGPGDKVLVPVQTFISTGMAICNIGAKPVFCDIRKETLCLDPKEIIANSGNNIKGVLLVHFGGLISPDTVEIKELCLDGGYVLIEDAAHAHGAELDGQKAGFFGDAACFSYYPTKIITAGEGGMIVTKREDISSFCISHQYRGQGMALPGEQFVLPFGRNIRISEFNALLGVLQYKKLNQFLQKRRRLAAIYTRELEKEPTIYIPPLPKESNHSYWLFTIVIPKDVDRQMLKDKLLDKWNVTIDWSYYPPLHLMPVFRDKYNYRRKTLQVAEDILARIICLPIHPLLTEDEVRYVAESFLDIYYQLSGKN